MSLALAAFMSLVVQQMAHPELRGWKELRILVEPLPPRVRRTHISRAALAEMAEVEMRRDGIRIVASDLAPYLYVQVGGVGSTDGILGGSVKLELYVPAKLENGSQTLACVWSEQFNYLEDTALLAPRVRDFLAQLLTKFSADYVRENGPPAAQVLGGYDAK